MVHLLLSRVHACIFRVFTKEQYFDSDGLFFSTVYSTPVLFNCLLLLVRVLSPPVLIYTYSMEPFYVGSTFVNFGGVNIAQMYSHALQIFRENYNPGNYIPVNFEY